MTTTTAKSLSIYEYHLVKKWSSWWNGCSILMATSVTLYEYQTKDHIIPIVAT